MQTENETLKKKIRAKEEACEEPSSLLGEATNDYVAEIAGIHDALRHYKTEITTLQTKLNSTNV